MVCNNNVKEFPDKFKLGRYYNLVFKCTDDNVDDLELTLVGKMGAELVSLYVSEEDIPLVDIQLDTEYESKVLQIRKKQLQEELDSIESKLSDLK